MEAVRIVLQLVIALGIVNVWFIRFGKPSAWRGGSAQNMREEFAAYGLPSWTVGVVGFLKVGLAALLIAGIWYPILIAPSAWGMAMLMAGAISMHVKVKDPATRSLPAFTMLVLSVIVAVL